MTTESLAAAVAAAPPDRVAWARYNFERWARSTTAYVPCKVGGGLTPWRWDDLAVTEQAIWIDMVAMMEGQI